MVSAAAHAWDTQNGVPPVQDVAQLPQCAAVVMLSVQPAVGFVHAPKPASQVGLHAPELHVVAVAFCVPHVTLQPPQLVASLAVPVSQPLLGLRSQSLKLARHTGWQALPTQLLLEVSLSRQGMAQPPQLALLERSCVSQPLLLLLSQLLK